MTESSIGAGDRATPPREAPPEILLFDLDGTLVDTVADIAFAANAALSETGRPEVPTDTVRTFVGDGARELMARCIAHVGEGQSGAAAEIDLATSRFREIYSADPCRLARPYPGVVTGLGSLGERSRLAVVTNKPLEIAMALLESLGLASAFELVVGERGVGRSKPDPAPLTFALQALGGRSGRAWMVGDGLQDLRAGRAAGIRVAAALWGFVAEGELRALAPDLVVASFGDLVARWGVAPAGRA